MAFGKSPQAVVVVKSFLGSKSAQLSTVIIFFQVNDVTSLSLSPTHTPSLHWHTRQPLQANAQPVASTRPRLPQRNSTFSCIYYFLLSYSCITSTHSTSSSFANGVQWLKTYLLFKLTKLGIRVLSYFLHLSDPNGNSLYGQNMLLGQHNSQIKKCFSILPVSTEAQFLCSAKCRSHKRSLWRFKKTIFEQGSVFQCDQMSIKVAQKWFC